MPRFRKKPVVIEAVKLIDWDRDRNSAPSWLSEALLSGVLSFHPERDGLIVKTLEGDHFASIEDDWIIRGIKGELYPCKADIFELTYEPAPEAP